MARTTSGVNWQSSALLVALSIISWSTHIDLVSAQSAPPTKAPYMTSKELRSMYSGKTWRWGESAGGYFAPGGQFYAITDTGYGKGRWTAEKWGNLCMNASWFDKKKTYRVKTCFMHVKWNNKIYQKKQGGEWYVFGNTPMRKSDPMAQLVGKDLVRDKLPKK